MNNCKAILKRAGLIVLAGVAVALSAVLPGPVDDCYTLGAKDRLSIRVFWHDDLTINTEVASDGTIVYPLLGAIQVFGLCPKELERFIEEGLEKDYLQDAQVVVHVTEKRSRSVAVLGKVARPGKIALPGPSRLLDVISLAGGVTSAAVRKILIIQMTDTLTGSAQPGKRRRREALLINSKRLFEEADLSLNVKVEDGDFVYVIDPSAGKFYITGEVARPGAYDIMEDLTVMKAITLAGGPTKMASMRTIHMKRIENGKEEKERVDLHSQVHEDDIIVVPESLF